MEEKTKKKIEKALIKRAVGYDAEETIEEFSSDENGEQRLLKRKVTTKNFPPDVQAAKLLLDMDEGEDFLSLSDDELENERKRLYKILEDIKKDDRKKN
ncbi:MAG: hypothetical protein IJ800_05130 [Clostridia bacterium]|nr:hypothetical protein [Clostridia bacterium]